MKAFMSDRMFRANTVGLDLGFNISDQITATNEAKRILSETEGSYMPIRNLREQGISDILAESLARFLED